MPRKARRVRNEELFRDVNERILDQANQDAEAEFLCECGDENCIEAVPVPFEEFERVRQGGGYMLRPGHEDPTIDRVVETHDGWIVVEKFIRDD
jgi:hypothetical protein